ncbi:MAG: helix-turn-helix transcriptional regulator [Clostridiales bacterium]|nr:helix-turn-helix transcriptional regulator [Clostridiales bacterium]
MDERHWTEYRLAEQAGLSRSTISNIFRRNNAPALATLETLCEAFGITLSQFFMEGKEPIALTDEQRKLLAKWNMLSAHQKEVLLRLIDIM